MAWTGCTVENSQGVFPARLDWVTSFDIAVQVVACDRIIGILSTEPFSGPAGHNNTIIDTTTYIGYVEFSHGAGTACTDAMY